MVTFLALRTEDKNFQPAPAPRRKFSSRVRAPPLPLQQKGDCCARPAARGSGALGRSARSRAASGSSQRIFRSPGVCTVSALPPSSRPLPEPTASWSNWGSQPAGPWAASEARRPARPTGRHLRPGWPGGPAGVVLGSEIRFPWIWG